MWWEGQLEVAVEGRYGILIWIGVVSLGWQSGVPGSCRVSSGAAGTLLLLRKS